MLIQNIKPISIIAMKSARFLATNCLVGSLRDGKSRLALAEECFSRYVANKAKQGYTLIDLGEAKERYIKGFLGTYEEFAVIRRGE